MMFPVILLFAALAYSILAGWRLWVGRSRRIGVALAFALFAMAFWSASMLSSSVALVALATLARNLAWLYYIATALGPRDLASRRAWMPSLATSLTVLAIMCFAASLLSARGVLIDDVYNVGIVASLTVRLIFSVLAVVYVHNLYQATADDTSTGFRTILLTVGVLWAYDINLYTVALLGYQASLGLAEGRALVAIALFPAFAVAARRKQYWKIRFSRQAAFQSLSIIALGVYFVGMSIAARTSTVMTGPNGVLLGVVIASALSGLAAVLILSPHSRAWLKVMVTKHLFSHRYDYRTEWLRFSATIGDDVASPLSTDERVVKSIGDVIDSPAGLLLLRNEQAAFDVAARWNWGPAVTGIGHPIEIEESLRVALEDGLVVMLDSLRGEGDDPRAGGLLAIPKTWIAVPLIRLGSLIGIVTLARPAVKRALDWEDFDLLKVVGQQATVHVIDGLNQSRLEEARRFEEFNRRFAFIIHDIKNVVSQLSLVASNAREHGSNPKFQADMVRSLTGAVERMTVLLSRLSTDRTVAAVHAGKIDIDPLLRQIAQDRTAQRPVTIAGHGPLHVIADAEKLRLALDHLIQNAIEASPLTEPVGLSWTAAGAHGVITIADRGTGMSADFIRRDLFKPFVSTKGGGFGIGAAEAKALIASMGGTVSVTSVEGGGSQFTIELLLSASGMEQR